MDQTEFTTFYYVILLKKTHFSNLMLLNLINKIHHHTGCSSIAGYKQLFLLFQYPLDSVRLCRDTPHWKGEFSTLNCLFLHIFSGGITEEWYNTEF